MTALFHVIPGHELVLASSSPRRIQLLAATGLIFSTSTPTTEEPEPRSGEEPAAYAIRAATAKGLAIPEEIQNRIILAADTVVCIDNAILRKPLDKNDAFAMLKRLNGKTHEVFTGYSLTFAGLAHPVTGCERTAVRFGFFSDAILHAYAISGEPDDKAGAYAISGAGAFLVEGIKGSCSNVVGLPIHAVIGLLLKHGLIKPTGKTEM